MHSRFSDPENAAKLLKWCLMRKHCDLQFLPNIERIKANAFLDKHRCAIERLCTVFTKHSLNVQKYIEFFVMHLGMRSCDIDTKLLSNSTMNEYVAWLKMKQKQDMAMECFLKTAKLVA